MSSTGSKVNPPNPPSRSLAILYPTQVFAGAMVISIGPVLDPILRDLHIPLAKGGLLSMGFAFGRVLGVILLNFALARVSLRALMIGAGWVAAVGLAVSAFLANGLWPLFIGLVVIGVPVVIPNAISGIWVGAHLRERTEKGMLMVTGFFAVGVVIAPLAIGAALDLGATWRWVFLGEAVFSLAIAALLMVAPLADVPDRENLRVRQLREVAGYDPRLLAVMLAAGFLYVSTETTLGVWLPKFQVDRFAASPALAALSVTLLWVGITLGRYAAVPLSRRILPSKLLAGFTVGFAAFGLGVVLSPTLAASEAFCFFAGLGASACFPLIASYANRFPGWYSAVAFSGMMLVGTSASTIFPYLVGPVAAALSLRMALGLSALPLFPVLILAFVLHRVSKESTPAVR